MDSRENDSSEAGKLIGFDNRIKFENELFKKRCLERLNRFNARNKKKKVALKKKWEHYLDEIAEKKDAALTLSTISKEVYIQRKTQLIKAWRDIVDEAEGYLKKKNKDKRYQRQLDTLNPEDILIEEAQKEIEQLKLNKIQFGGKKETVKLPEAPIVSETPNVSGEEDKTGPEHLSMAQIAKQLDRARRTQHQIRKTHMLDQALSKKPAAKATVVVDEDINQKINSSDSSSESDSEEIPDDSKKVRIARPAVVIKKNNVAASFKRKKTPPKSSLFSGCCFSNKSKEEEQDLRREPFLKRK